MATGRSSEPRAVTVTTTSGSAALTAAALTFNEEDAGRVITAAGIPAAATLLSVASDTAATLSANATSSAAVAAVIGSAQGVGPANYGFTGWSPETDAESEAYTVAANIAGTVPPDRVANAYSPVAAQRGRG